MYEFESSGGNIEYQTTQQVEGDANKTDTDFTLVTTGISVEGNTIEGIAIVEVSDTAVPADIFESATGVHQIEVDDLSEQGDNEQTGQQPAADPQPAEEIVRFERQEDMADLLADVSETPERVFSSIQISLAVMPSDATCGSSP